VTAAEVAADAGFLAYQDVVAAELRRMVELGGVADHADDPARPGQRGEL
jgi:hypothetical protein